MLQYKCLAYRSAAAAHIYHLKRFFLLASSSFIGMHYIHVERNTAASLSAHSPFHQFLEVKFALNISDWHT